MRIADTYSHLYGEEYLIVHHNDLYEEIKAVVAAIDADVHRTKESKEQTPYGQLLYSPISLNQAFDQQFRHRNWHESHYPYYTSPEQEALGKSPRMEADAQRRFLIGHGEAKPTFSYNQTDYVKDKIAVEVQLGKYVFVAYDLFVKHMLFYSGGVIDLGIEILPTKKIQAQMSSGVAYFEGEVYNVMRQNRNNPPVPLLVLGIEP
ncbi:MAG: hypothetical protein OHK0039_28880 [Bacteroidia bacterium]